MSDPKKYAEEFKRAELVGGTLGSLALGTLIPSQEWSTVVAEENGQTWEVETLQALLRCKRAILVGDPSQLKRSVREPMLKNSGLDTSAMERLGRQLSKSVLRRNYRSHPSCVRHFSDLFYRSAVTAACTKASFPTVRGISWPKLGCERLIFVNVESNEESVHGGIFNRGEVRVRRWIVEAVLAQNAVEPSELNSEFLGVISPYREQYALLRRELDFWQRSESGRQHAAWVPR